MYRNPFRLSRESFMTQLAQADSIDLDVFCLDLYNYQYQYNTVYHQWCNAVGGIPDKVNTFASIPFLPIVAFKKHKVVTGKWESDVVFESSGTTGQINSKHYLKSEKDYLQNAKRIWSEEIGSIRDFCVLALLPNYLERSGSSLVSMVANFIDESKFSQSGFYLYNHDELYNQLVDCKRKKIPTVLFGVSFALLDFVHEFQVDFPELIIMETGGMKGRRAEMTKSELHNAISGTFNTPRVYSEYGMTELLSQCYSSGFGVFEESSTMKVRIMDMTDPFTEIPHGRTGVINIIDLANIDSCAFIQTQDLGVKHSSTTFEILGRLDQSDIRGCNLMVSDL